MRTPAALSLGLAAGIFGFTAAAGLTGSRLAATLLAALTTGLVVLLVQTRPILPDWPIDWRMGPRHLAVVNALPQAVTVSLAVLALRTQRPMGGEHPR